MSSSRRIFFGNVFCGGGRRPAYSPILWAAEVHYGHPQAIHNAGVRGSSPCVATKQNKGLPKGKPLFCFQGRPNAHSHVQPRCPPHCPPQNLVTLSLARALLGGDNAPQISALPHRGVPWPCRSRSSS